MEYEYEQAIEILRRTPVTLTALLRGLPEAWTTSTGLPDDALVCYVELRGALTFAAAPGVTLTFQRGYEVFDAHTGNLLMWGGRP